MKSGVAPFYRFWGAVWGWIEQCSALEELVVLGVLVLLHSLEGMRPTVCVGLKGRASEGAVG